MVWGTALVRLLCDLQRAERSPLLPLLRASSAIVHCAATLRAWLYDSRMLPVYRCGKPALLIPSVRRGCAVCITEGG